MKMSGIKNPILQGKDDYNQKSVNATAEPNENGQRKLPGAVLTGIIVGSVLMLILSLFVLSCLISKFRTRRKKQKVKNIRK